MASTASAASSTLSDLISGGTLSSDNGKLTFSNFGFVSTLGSQSASSIGVMSTDSGIRFSPTTFAGSNSVTDYLISYDVQALDGCEITSASMTSIGTNFGQGGFVLLAEVVSSSTGDLGDLGNKFGAPGTQSSDSIGFSSQSSLNISNNFAIGNDAFLSDVQQSFGVECDTVGTPIPTPSAALAGIALLGMMTSRRRRRGEAE